MGLEHPRLKFCCNQCPVEFKQLKHLVMHYDAAHRPEYQEPILKGGNDGEGNSQIQEYQEGRE